MTSVQQTPFKDAAWGLYRSDWGDPHVVVFRTKTPKLKGWSGYEGATPSAEDIHEWVEQFPSENIGLRLAGDLVGFDIDEGDTKSGARTWEEFASRHGEQDDTWTVTARGADSPRRTLIFRVPEGTDTKLWRDSAMVSLGGDIEIIRRWHRHQMWPPSVHPGSGTPYVLYTPDGLPWTADLPSKDEIPILSNEAVTHMDKRCSCFYEPRRIQVRRERAIRQRSKASPSSKRRGALRLLENRAARLSRMGADTYRNGVLNNGFYLFVNQVHAEGTLTEREVWERLFRAGIAAGLGEDEVTRTLRSARDAARKQAGVSS